MHAVTAVPVATAINLATAVTASAARTAVPLGCTGIVYALRCKWESAASGSSPKWECAVSGNRAAMKWERAGSTRFVANRCASSFIIIVIA